jgi:hypothetical protein
LEEYFTVATLTKPMDVIYYHYLLLCKMQRRGNEMSIFNKQEEKVGVIDAEREFGDRAKAYHEAIRKAALRPPLDPMPWRIMVERSKDSKELAEKIRLSSSKTVKTMATFYYASPEYVVQWVVSNEELAKAVEESSSYMEAVERVHEHAGEKIFRR